MEETDATRAVRRRVAAPAAMGEQGSNQALGIDISDESAEDRRQQAAAEAAEERRARAADEPPSFVASCCVPMETDMMTAPPAREGRAAAQALNTVEAFVRAFNRPDAVRGAEGGAPCPFGAMSAPSCANLRPAVGCERCEGGPEFDPELGIAPEFTAEVYDPELGIAPEFTEVRTGTGVHIIRDAAGAVIEWPWESRRSTSPRRRLTQTRSARWRPTRRCSQA